MTLPLTGLFVTGTDTGVGKTTFACALARLALRRGHPFVPFKPAETGCAPEPADARALWRAAGSPGDPALTCLYPLPLPAAPAVAAAAAGITLSLADITARAVKLARNHDRPLLVEGAGGLLVPYAGALTTADLAVAMDLPVVVVARAALGTVNHTALTLRELSRHTLKVAALVLVQTTPAADDPRLDNAGQIRILTGIAVAGTLPYLPGADPDQLADALEAALPPATLDALLAP